MSAEFVAAMEDVLELYGEPYDPKRPVVCFDETSTQLLGEARPPLPTRPGLPRRQDYEYRRQGTRNLFLACEPLRGWRHVAITQRRTRQDFAHQMRWLVDEAYPETQVVRVVLDNLNTHRPASLSGIPQIKPTFLDIAPSGIPSNIIPHSKGIKCGLIRSNSPFSYSNHRPAKPKIPKPLVYAQVSPLGTSFATP